MTITRDRIREQIQTDSAAYDALSDALKEVLVKEVAVVRRSYAQNERGISPSYMMHVAQAI
jgi:hypothetical protein